MLHKEFPVFQLYAVANQSVSQSVSQSKPAHSQSQLSISMSSIILSQAA